MAIKLVVGLGNPGSKYEDTPHNIGYHVIESLQTDPPSRRVKLEKSEGFMNASGASVFRMAQYANCDPTELLIVCDDIDLPKGQLRIRLQGSSGGHNGLKSIFEAFGGRTDIPRLRLGIGRGLESEDPAKYVLREAKDFIEFTPLVIRGAAAVRKAVDLGIEEAMNEFNQKDKNPSPPPSPARGEGDVK